MNSYLSIVAAALLTTPPGVLELPEISKAYYPLAPALRALAIHWEILDTKETTYILVKPSLFDDDLKMLQGRFQDLANAPPIADCARLPDRNMIAELTAFNRSYREAVASRLEIDRLHSEELRAILDETDLLYRIWDTLRDAQCDYYFITYRRQALKLLREMIGDPAYYSGQLPPHLPLWRIPIGD